jgi:MoaA/NifB/PqqE/SkfB family radical SAM enzyme
MCNIPRKRYDAKEELKLSELKDLVTQIAEWGIRYISFAGGEPLLRKRVLIKLIEHAKDKGLFTALITSGYLLNRETCKQLISCGLNKLSISIDGANAETHDFIRGRGSFGRAVKAARFLVWLRRRTGAKIELEFATCVLKYNFRQLLDIYDLMRRIGFDYITYQAVVADNLYRMSNPSFYEVDFWLDTEESKELERIAKKLIEIKEKEGRIRNTKRYLQLMPAYFKLRDKFKPDLCLAGFKIINIDARGNLNICGFGPWLSVRGKSLKELWFDREYRKTRIRIKRCSKPCLMLCYEKMNLKALLEAWFDAKLGERLHAIKMEA